MAIVHTRLKVLSRSTRSTVAALAYRSGTELVDQDTGEVHNYLHKSVSGVELLLPDDAPKAWKDLQSLIQKDKHTGVQKLSNIAEAHEKRKDAQVYREYEFALPRELTDDENKILAREFVQDQICGLGMAAELNFHFDVDEDGNRFPHVHVVMLTRRLDNNANLLGLSRLKEREWNRKELAKELRFQFCEYANFHFKQKGIDIILDPRSYAEQGIDLEPQVKIGKNVSEMEARQGKTDRGKEYNEVKLSNQFTIIKNPQVVIDEITSKQTTFTEQDIHKVLNRYIDDRDLHLRLVGQVKSLKSVIDLNKDGLYTTQDLIQNEQSFLSKLTDLQTKRGHVVPEALVEKEIEKTNQLLSNKHNSSLSPDQIEALKAMVAEDRLVFVEGYAGSGKTTVVETAATIWKASGYNVVGLAPTNKAKEGLKSAGINAYTVHSFLHSYAHNRQQFHHNTVLVLDEAGMVDLKRYTGLLRAIHDLDVKLVSLGDRGQLTPVEAGCPFTMASTHYDFTKLTSIIRQTKEWQKKATQAFGDQNGLKGLQSYLDNGHIKFVRTTNSDDKRFQAKAELMKDWITYRAAHPHKTACILAHSNKDVADLNNHVRSHLRTTGDITGKDCTYVIEQMKEGKFGQTRTVSEERSFAVGDQIVFTRTNKGLGVHNGSLGRITSLNKLKIQVELEDKVVSFSPRLFRNFDLAWAMTVYKSQGATFDEGFVLGSRGLYANLIYVALTRHKENAHLYLSQNEFKSIPKALEWLSRKADDFTLSTIISFEQMKDLTTQEPSLVLDVLSSAKNMVSAIKYVGSRKLNEWSGMTPQTYKSDSEALVSSYLDAEGLQKAHCASKLLEEVKAQDEIGARDMRASLQAADMYPNSLELKLLDLVARESSPSKSSLQAALTFIETVNTLSDFRTQQENNSYNRLADLHYRYAQSLGAIHDAFETYQPLKKLGYDAESLVSSVVSMSRDMKISVLDQIHASKRDDQKSTLSVYTPIKQTVMASIGDMNTEKQWGLSDSQVKGFADVVMQASLNKVTLNAKSSLTREQYNTKTRLQQEKTDAGIALMKTNLRDKITSLEDRWAVTLTDTYRNTQKAESLLSAYQASSGLDKSKLAHEITDIMDGDSDFRPHVRGAFNGAGLYRKSVELSLYSRFHEVSETLEGKDALITKVEAFGAAYAARRDAWNQKVNSAEVSKAVLQAHEKAMDTVYETFESCKLNGHLTAQDLQSLERTGLNLRETKEDDRFDVLKSELERVNKRKEFGLTDNHIVDLTKDLCELVQAKEEINDEIFKSISNKGDFKTYKNLLNAQKETAKALASSEVGEQLMASPGRWAGILEDSREKEEDLYPETQGNADSRNPPPIDHSDSAGKHIVNHRSTSRFEMTNHEFSQFVEKINASIQGEELAKDLLRSRGLNEKSSSSTGIRFGRQGSLLLTIDGPHANSWFDFESGEGGNLLQLIQRETGCNFKTSLAYVVGYCRGPMRSEIDRFLDGQSIDRASMKAIPQKDKDDSREMHLKQQKQKIVDLNKLVEKSVPIEGSPAELYLRNERHIQGELPDSIRYLPAQTKFMYNGAMKSMESGAMISIAKLPTGEIKAVQLTYLRKNGTRAINRNGEKFTKVTYGSLKGSYVTLQEGSGPFIMAEGVETALSVKEAAVNGKVVCSLGIGNYKNIITDQKDVIIAADWDGSKDKPTYEAAAKAKAYVEDKGGQAQIILPIDSTDRNPVKTDFNDILQEKGLASVKKLLNNQAGTILKESEKTRAHEHPLTRDQKEAASHQYEHAAENAPQMGKGQLVANTPEQDTQEALKQNILTYFKHELSLEENAGFHAERILDQASKDPIETLKWWQEECDGSPLNPHNQSSPKQNESEPTKDISDIFAEKINQLDAYIDLLSDRNGYEKSLAYNESERSELLDSVSDNMLQKLQTKYPEIADRVEQQRFTNLQRDHSRGQDISL